MLDQKIGDDFLAKLAAPLNETNTDRISVLFRDFVVCAISGARKYRDLNSLGTNPHEMAIGLGLCSSADDLDDVDWTVLTHPGSIIWPVAVALGRSEKTELNKIFQAAAHGYSTGASMAAMMGIAHRSKQHLTSTAGAFAATSTAAFILKLSESQHVAALKMTAANIGGSSQAGFERAGATQFNRVSAITLGITSAKSAKINAPHVDDIWNGPFGLIEFNGVEARTFELKDGISTASIRLFPMTGFGHSALGAAINIAPKITSEILAIDIYLPSGITKLMDGSRGGKWWNPISGISAYFNSRNPFELDDDSKYLNLTKLHFEDLPTGAGKIQVKTKDGIFEETCLIPPGKKFDSLISKKWIKLIGQEISNDESAYNLCSSFPDLALR